MSENEKIPVGVSMCLMGEPVRYNGEGCRDKILLGPLSKYLDYKPFCPEVGIGLGVPRPTLKLVKKNGEDRLCNSNDKDLDYSDQMQDWSDEKLQIIEDMQLCGFVFKKSSPSCGAFRVKVYNEEGNYMNNKSRGLFADAVIKRFPWMPVEEEGRLHDAGLFENFIMRVFAIKQWKKMIASGVSISKLMTYHQSQKYRLMAHTPTGLKKLGVMLAESKGKDLNEVAELYFRTFCEVTEKPATRSRHCNALQHILGYFRNKLDDFDRHEIHETIEQYHDGIVPLVVPLSRLASCTKKYQEPYLLTQAYLNYPVDLGLLNRL